MGLFNWGLNKKSASSPIIKRGEGNNIVGIEMHDTSSYLGMFTPHVMGDNFIEIFSSMGEVYFPIRYIVDKIAGGHYLLKKIKDDSVVWDNEEINKFLSKPNPIQSFTDMITLYFIYKYVSGNSYFHAAAPESFSKSGELWKWCESYWVLPSNKIDIKTPNIVPLFTSAKIEEIISYYGLNTGMSMMQFSPSSILHTKDVNMKLDNNYLKGMSRLYTQRYPIANLAAVYEARNVIYIKRGALGALISKKYDATGSLPLEKNEKEDIRKEYQDTYGLSAGKSPIAIINSPVEFAKFNMSIAELQPFDETLADACQIAGAYNVPSVLIPRKDMSTFSNQNTAEISVYANTVIPEAKRFTQDLTSFLGLTKSGLYIDVDFDHVELLQSGQKNRAQTKKIISDKCKQDFSSGVITLNDWRAQIDESRVADPLYNKLILQMSDEELDRIQIVLKSGGSLINQEPKLK